MKYKKSPLDRFLEQRINDNAKELKQTLNETLRMEQKCLEQIRHSINHCKNNIAVCEKQIKSVVQHLWLSSKQRNLHLKIIYSYGIRWGIFKWPVLK